MKEHDYNKTAGRNRFGLAGATVLGLASALALADDLARLMDDMQTRKVPWSALDTLVPEEHDAYWKLTLDFLKIARDTWPDFLREIDRIEPAARRDLLIAADDFDYQPSER